MCLLRIEEHEDKWRLGLVNFVDAGDFLVLLEQYQPLDASLRSKYVFELTLWKSLNASMNKLKYRQGFCYRFDKVRSLKVLYGNLVGSIQIRQRMRTEPVVAPHPSNALIPESAGASISNNLTCGSSSHVSGDDELAATPQRDRDGDRLTPPQPHRHWTTSCRLLRLLQRPPQNVKHAWKMELGLLRSIANRTRKHYASSHHPEQPLFREQQGRGTCAEAYIRH
ncbi:hypothetical protein PHMEG_00033282 [Phytophthora megakarya]|uniref:Uncharacterized protein n=1 Tax=Phytophthora megakarya TaxID=4795 RepID=A0A225UU00_9STRA|nr:hypothetical protein PHMEG_00033282 [Phytophthora megakarya]